MTGESEIAKRLAEMAYELPPGNYVASIRGGAMVEFTVDADGKVVEKPKPVVGDHDGKHEG